jgi:fibronectin type 3 domain-containing protein
MASNLLVTAGMLVELYIVLAYLGVGIYALVGPASLKKSYLYALLSPGFGFCLLAIVGSWVMVANVPTIWTMVLSLVIATALNLLVFLRAKVKHKMYFRRLRPTKRLLVFVPVIMISFGLLLLIASPGIVDGAPTTPVRQGPDSIGYAGAAQTLLNGGTLSSISEDLRAATGETDLEKAKQESLRVMRFDVHCSAEFLLKALRWGYPVILANATWLVGQDSVYRLDFILPIFSWMMLAALAYYACRSIIGARRFLCFLLTTALVLNCNLLNVYYEGSYAQVMATPIVFVLLLCLFYLRHQVAPETRSGRLRLIMFMGFLGAALLSIWAEACGVLAIVFFIVLVFDVVRARRMLRAWPIRFGLAAVLALALAAPITSALIPNLYAHAAGLRAAGWAQPKWANLSDMMGWTDMYAHAAWPGLPVPGGIVGILFVYGGSVLILGMGARFLLVKKRDFAFWAGPLLLLVLVVLVSVFWQRTINYQYYKSYTALLPIIFVLVYASLLHPTQTVRPKIRHLLYGIVGVTLAATVANGVAYIAKYDQQALVFTESMSQLKRDSTLLEGYVLMTPNSDSVWRTLQFAAVTKTVFYDDALAQWYGTRVAQQYLERPVALMLFDVSQFNQQRLSEHGWDMIYSAVDFAVVKTSHMLKDGVGKDGKADVNVFLYPTGPSALFATTISTTQIDLAWGAVPGASSYQVWRSTGTSTTFTKIATVTSPQYSDKGLTAGTSYNYEARAVAGNTLSNYSPVTIAQTQLAVPVGLEASTVSATEIVVTWGPVAGASGYEVWRATGGSAGYSRVATTTQNSFDNTGLVSGTRYGYKIRAVAERASSDYSAETTANTQLAVPTWLTASTVDTAQIDLAWGAVPGASSYQVWRSTGTSTTFTKIATVTSPQYSDTGLTAGTGYNYEVCAVGAYGEGARSEPATGYTNDWGP